MREAPRRKAERPADKQAASHLSATAVGIYYHIYYHLLRQNTSRKLHIYIGSRMVVFRPQGRACSVLEHTRCSTKRVKVDSTTWTVSLHTSLRQLFGVQPVMCLARQRTTSTRLTLAFLAVRKLNHTTRGVFLRTNSFSLSTLYTRYIRTYPYPPWFKRSDSF